MTFKGSTSAVYDNWAEDGPTPFGGNFTYSTDSSFVIARPTGVTEGDILMMGFLPIYRASPDNLSSGQHLTVSGPGTWTAHLGHPFAWPAQILWKVAGASEPSSYTIQILNNFDDSVVHAYALIHLGAWSPALGTAVEFDLADPVSLGESTGSQWARCASDNNGSFPPRPAGSTPDIDTCTITGSETLAADSVIVYFVGGSAGYENGDDTSQLPSSAPWVPTTIQPPITQHAQVHVEGLATAEDYADPTVNGSTLAQNATWTMGSMYASPGPIPDGAANFSWYHMPSFPTDEGFAEDAFIYRLVIYPVESPAYWGILHATPM